MQSHIYFPRDFKVKYKVKSLKEKSVFKRIRLSVKLLQLAI